jgi:hypothetical protein
LESGIGDDKTEEKHRSNRWKKKAVEKRARKYYTLISEGAHVLGKAVSEYSSWLNDSMKINEGEKLR